MTPLCSGGLRPSFAELGDEVKNKISHRARALAALRRFLHGDRSRPAPMKILIARRNSSIIEVAASKRGPLRIGD